MVSCNGMARKAIANAPGVPSGLDRPMPPGEMWEEEATGRFVPAPEVVDWIRRAILDERGPIHNPDHVHLRMARIGVLWTDLPARRQMRAIVGQAEMPQPRGSAWARARQEQQLREWFGGGVDFLITLYAPHAAAIDDASWCALVEHELYHCGQAVDRYGVPRFRRDGTPVWAIRGHDAEEFVGVVARYGPGAAAGGVADLVRAALLGPTVAPARISAACGTCLARAA